MVFAAPKSIQCTHCFKLGHEAKNCYLLIGFPERTQEHRWADRSSDSVVARGCRRSSFNQSKGHSGKVWVGRTGQPPHANWAATAAAMPLPPSSLAKRTWIEHPASARIIATDNWSDPPPFSSLETPPTDHGWSSSSASHRWAAAALTEPLDGTRHGGAAQKMEETAMAQWRGIAVAAASCVVRIPGLSLKQWHKFLDLLDSKKSSPPDDDTLSDKIKCKWIIDSGCSHHMTGWKTFLSNIKPSHPYTVTLPNGSKTTEVEMGSLCLDSTLQIDNVLHISQLRCNLLSLSQLSKTNNCVIIIKDRTMGMPIGAGEKRDGIYYFRPISVISSFAHTVFRSDAGDLWHKRIGHPSKSLTNKFLGQYLKSDSLKKCSICLRTK